jgi:hypothetical protein
MCLAFNIGDPASCLQRDDSKRLQVCVARLFTEYFRDQRVPLSTLLSEVVRVTGHVGFEDVDKVMEQHDLHTHHFEHNMLLIMGFIASLYVSLAIPRTIQDEAVTSVSKSTRNEESSKRANEIIALRFNDRKAFNAIKDLIGQGRKVAVT